MVILHIVLSNIAPDTVRGLVGYTLIGRSQNIVSTFRVAGPRHEELSLGFVGACGPGMGSVDVTNSKCNRHRRQTEMKR